MGKAGDTRSRVFTPPSVLQEVNTGVTGDYKGANMINFVPMYVGGVVHF
jgi:hypothetical protein